MHEKKTKANFVIDKELWKNFVSIAKYNDETATQLLRKFIKSYVSENSQLALKARKGDKQN